jgi:hypothetical protein
MCVIVETRIANHNDIRRPKNSQCKTRADHDAIGVCGKVFHLGPNRMQESKVRRRGINGHASQPAGSKAFKSSKARAGRFLYEKVSPLLMIAPCWLNICLKNALFIRSDSI